MFHIPFTECGLYYHFKIGNSVPILLIGKLRLRDTAHLLRGQLLKSYVILGKYFTFLSFHILTGKTGIVRLTASYEG